MDSLKKRYFIKLAKSSVSALINVLLLLFVPRVLGPAAYGNFNFIRDSFQSIIALSDLNLGSAHINHAARKESSQIASNVYFTYTLLVGIVVLLFLSIITLTDLDQYIFPGQESDYLFMGALMAYLMYLFTALMGLSDSKGATYGFESISIVIIFVLFGVLVALYLTDNLNLTTLFEQRISLYIILLGFGTWYLYRKINFRPRVVNLAQREIRTVIHEFFSFAHPLITLSEVGIFFGFFDRWFLQFIYGSVPQGFFSLAFSLSAIAGLFLTPMTPLLMQSVAKADEDKDLEGVRNAFEKVKLLYFVGVFLSIFFMFHTEEVIGLIGGDSYNAAKMTVLVMFLYPIHVVYGQFCGGVLIALRKTHLYRNIALVSAFIGIVITYILLAPKAFFIPGLELGSLGLAMKLVMVQLFSVTIQLYFVCKIVNVKMSHFLLSQLIIPIPVILVGFCDWLIRNYIELSLHGVFENVVSLTISMMLWSIVMGIVIWRFPRLIGLNKSTIRDTVKQVINKFKMVP